MQRLPHHPRIIQSAVQIKRRADQGEMRERLGEVAQLFAFGAELLAKKTEMVGIAEHFFEEKAGLVEVAAAAEAFHIPEAAHAKRPFRAGDAVHGIDMSFGQLFFARGEITVDEAV